MRIWDIINKHKFLFYGSSLILSVGAYLLATNLGDSTNEQEVENEEESQQKKDEKKLAEQKLEDIPQSEQQQMNQELDGLTEQDLQETLALKKELQQLVEIEMDNQYLSDKTIKNIYTRAIQLCLQKLIMVHDQLITQRRQNISNIKQYAYLTVELFNAYFELLNTALRTVIILLEIDEVLFDQSRVYQEQQQKLRPAYIRDLAWHFMAEVRSENQLTKEQYVEYLKFQIEQIKVQYDELKETLKEQNLMTKKLLINARVDDITYEKLNISDYDSIRYQREYMKDEEVATLLKQRNESLDIIII